MTRPDGVTIGRQSDVDCLGNQHRGVTLGEEDLTTSVVRVVDPSAEDVDALTGVRLFLARKAAESPASEGDRGLVPQVLHLDVRQRIQVSGVRQRLLGVLSRSGQRLFGEYTRVDLRRCRALIFGHGCDAPVASRFTSRTACFLYCLLLVLRASFRTRSSIVSALVLSQASANGIP